MHCCRLESTAVHESFGHLIPRIGVMKTGEQNGVEMAGPWIHIISTASAGMTDNAFGSEVPSVLRIKLLHKRTSSVRYTSTTTFCREGVKRYPYLPRTKQERHLLGLRLVPCSSRLEMLRCYGPACRKGLFVTPTDRQRGRFVFCHSLVREGPQGAANYPQPTHGRPLMPPL
jgi:hypothetical protein